MQMESCIPAISIHDQYSYAVDVCVCKLACGLKKKFTKLLHIQQLIGPQLDAGSEGTAELNPAVAK